MRIYVYRIYSDLSQKSVQSPDNLALVAVTQAADLLQPKAKLLFISVEKLANYRNTNRTYAYGYI